MTPEQAPDGVREAVEKEVKHINQKVRSKAARVNNALRNAELFIWKWWSKIYGIHRKPGSVCRVFGKRYKQNGGKTVCGKNQRKGTAGNRKYFQRR